MDKVEAEKIAFEVAKINNEIPEDLDDHINDGNFSTKRDIQEIFNKKSEELKCQNANYINNKAYNNNNIEQIFSDNEKIENLNRISDNRSLSKLVKVVQNYKCQRSN
ncbi:hypothetical protein [Orientia tsutsugamushi]|uniref:Conjugal transfer protein TraG n=1 Tax=Orientia tsutsugamushi TaxID=784 RepID=A0A2U3RJC5_ORITS|nr:hypothetical protein [Orientia tsutsugamushi]KJV54349.1 hypothetical protein OTSKATO_1127 [Orientia tsutsugamushi str. Kato PP]SPR13277.1 conjugal transfer protein TraG [Orientia tsutsugamushi]